MIIKGRSGTYPKPTCRYCGVTEDQDYMTLQDFGNFDIDFSHPANSNRCLVQFEDGSLARVDADGIIRDVVDSAITRFAGQTATLILLALMGAMLALSIAGDDHVSGKTSNDFPVMEAK